MKKTFLLLTAVLLFSTVFLYAQSAQTRFENGKLLTAIEQLGSVRLNINDPLRFNSKTKSVYWAVNGGNRTINIYAYNLDHLIKINTSGRRGK